MVHALREAWRVLAPDGILIDLRPATVHRRVGLVRAGRPRWLGIMRERFDDDYAANRAVAEAVRRGLFETGGRARFGCNRTMDSLAELRAWMDQYVQLDKLPPHDWLLERVHQGLEAKRGKAKIVVTGPLDLHVLKRREPSRRGRTLKRNSLVAGGTP
jgi:hypothetical protein